MCVCVSIAATIGLLLVSEFGSRSSLDGNREVALVVALAS